MRFPRQSIIAGIAICFILVLLFIIYQILLIKLEIIVENQSTIYITPINDDFKSSKTNKENIAENNISKKSGGISLDTNVIVNNTGGDGLIIRALAGADGKPLYLGLDGEEFEIIDGPTKIDNQIWWKIKSIVDLEKVGWVVQDFLFIK